MVTINGRTSAATQFAWDGCHKIYLVENEVGLRNVDGYDLYPIARLAKAWGDSCGLRFISPADLDSPDYVKQFEDADIIFGGGEDA